MIRDRVRPSDSESGTQQQWLFAGLFQPAVKKRHEMKCVFYFQAKRMIIRPGFECAIL